MSRSITHGVAHGVAHLFVRTRALVALGCALAFSACRAGPTAPTGTSPRGPNAPPAFDAGATDSVPTRSGGYINPNV